MVKFPKNVILILRYRQFPIIRHSILRHPRHPSRILGNRWNTFHVKVIRYKYIYKTQNLLFKTAQYSNNCKNYWHRWWRQFLSWPFTRLRLHRHYNSWHFSRFTRQSKTATWRPCNNSKMDSCRRSIFQTDRTIRLLAWQSIVSLLNRRARNHELYWHYSKEY